MKNENLEERKNEIKYIRENYDELNEEEMNLLINSKIHYYNFIDIIDWYIDTKENKENFEKYKWILDLDIRGEYSGNIIDKILEGFGLQLTIEKAEWVLKQDLSNYQKSKIIYALSGESSIETVDDLIKNNLEVLIKCSENLYALPDNVIENTKLLVQKNIIKNSIKDYLNYENLIQVINDDKNDTWLEFKINNGYHTYTIYVNDKNKNTSEYWNRNTINEFINNVDFNLIDDSVFYELEENRKRISTGKKFVDWGC